MVFSYLFLDHLDFFSRALRCFGEYTCPFECINSWSGSIGVWSGLGRNRAENKEMSEGMAWCADIGNR